MLSNEQIIEIEMTIHELDQLNEALSVNLEKYADMYNKGFCCTYISQIMQEKIDKIKAQF